MNIPAVHFNSSQYPTADRFELWRNAVSASYDVETPEREKRSEIVVRDSAWMLGGMVLTEGCYSAQKMTRDQRKIRQTHLDHYRLCLPLHGGTINLTIGEQRDLVSDGQLIITDMAQPDWRTNESGERIVVVLPRDSVDALLPGSIRLHGLMPTGAAVAVLADHIRSLVPALPSLPTAVAPNVCQATLHLLVAAIVPVAKVLEPGRAALALGLRRQIARHIEAHLLDPNLTVDGICSAFRISRATLYRLLKPDGGFSAYIQERRLYRIHDLLTNFSKHHHLGRLADQHGFKSQAHMSRVYRAQFGYSPRETPPMPASMIANARCRTEDDLQAWLHSLHVATTI